MFGQFFQAGLVSEYESAKFARSGNAFEHSAQNLRRRMSTEFTKTVRGVSLLERLSIRSMILWLKIEGNFPCLRAIVAHMVGNLPPASFCEAIVIVKTLLSSSENTY